MKKGLVAGEVDINGKVGGFGCRLEAPASNCLLCCGAQQSVTGLDLRIRDGAVRLNGEMDHNCAADVHATSQLRVHGWDFGDDGAAGIARGVGQPSSQSQGAEKKKVCG
jgi:hypothetical protein